MGDDLTESDSWIALDSVPVPLIVLVTIDTLEYEAILELEEAASYRRRVIDTGGDKAAVLELLEELEASLDDVDRSRLEVSKDVVRLPIDPAIFEDDTG